MRNGKTKTAELAKCAVIAAAYAGLTILLEPVSYGPLQFRVAEVLCILPFFMPCSVWGLFVGCIIANVFGGNGLLDIVFGSLATLSAGLLTARCKSRWLALLPPVVMNGVIVGGLLAWLYMPENFLTGFALMGAEVAFGELVVMLCMGIPLMIYLPKSKAFMRLIDRE